MTQVEFSRKQILRPLVALRFDLCPPRHSARIEAELR